MPTYATADSAPDIAADSAALGSANLRAYWAFKAANTAAYKSPHVPTVQVTNSSTFVPTLASSYRSAISSTIFSTISTAYDAPIMSTFF